MRIKVVTSINVRSSPFASPSAVSQEPFPERCERSDAILDNSRAVSDLASGQPPRMDRFIASQRIPRGSRLSGWLHGSSVRANDRRRPPVHTQKATQASTYCFAATERGPRDHAPGIRSYPSTRGLIDPVHSPSHSPGQLTYGSDSRHDAYLERLRAELGALPRKHSTGNRQRRHRQNSKRAPAKTKRLCFPQINDLKMRQKIIGCIFFGTLLAIVLTTCTFSALLPPPSSTHPRLKHRLTTLRPRPRHIRILPRRHLPRRLHLLHHRPHHLLLPLPHPPVHAGLPAPDPLRAQMSVAITQHR